MDHKKKYDNLTQHGNLDQSGPQKNERKKNRIKIESECSKDDEQSLPQKEEQKDPGVERKNRSVPQPNGI